MKMKHWKLELDEKKVAHLSIDVAGKNANSLSGDVILEFKQVLDQLSSESPAALVIRSGKDSGFIAGADINEFETLNTESEAQNLIGQAHEVINQLDDFPATTIAVINGFCLGGGLELALACDVRIAVNQPATRLGLPEVKLGLHPGFGGTARSVDTVGVVQGMQMMLTGKSYSAYQAKKMGLVHEAVAERSLTKTIQQYLDKPVKKPVPGMKEKFMRSSPGRFIMSKVFAKEVAKKVKKEHFPAPYALIELFKEHGGDKKSFLQAEIASEASLIVSKESRNLVRVFQLSEMLKAKGKAIDYKAERVHVIGAGTMGGDIALWCALKGMTVTVEDFNLDALAATVKRAVKLYGKRFRGFDHLATAARDRLIVDSKGDGRANADIIIEAIVENLDIKQKVFSELEKTAKKDAILATNTSSIPLEDIAAGMKDNTRLVGIHFFNPATMMPLVEVVSSKTTKAKIRDQASAFCVQIDKLPLQVKSAPGFLVNRVLMPYMLEAATMAEEGIAYETIDKAATDFGMPMGPIELSDTVGLDICAHVSDVLAEPMQLNVPKSIHQKVEEKKLGVKSGEGYYKYKGRKAIKSNNYAKPTAEMQQRLIDKITLEAQRCLTEGIVATDDEVDAGIIFGTGFAPFTGGPLHHNKYGD